MMNNPDKQNVDLIEKFSLSEKIFIRIAFYGVIVIGAYGIYSENKMWGLLYMGFLFLGMLVLLFGLCSHCPYPHKYSECLIIPPFIMKKISKYHPGPMSIVKKNASIVVLGGLIIIPQFWLVKNYMLLFIFWLFCIPAFGVFPFYFCKRCQHAECPFNLREFKKTNE